MMDYRNLWNSLDSVKAVHNFLEFWALVFFGLLVLFDVLSHFSDEHPARAKKFARIGLFFFGVAVLAEMLAYPYSRRNDTLSSQQDREERTKIAILDNSTQGLKTEARHSKERAENLETGLELERQKTARFQKEADVARLALENQLIAQGPRYKLLEPERSKLIAKLSVFSGQKIIVVSCVGAFERPFSESGQTIAVITSILGDPGAKWKVEGRQNRGCGFPGIMAQISTMADIRTRDAATLITDLLAKILTPFFYVPRLPLPVEPRVLQVLNGAGLTEENDPMRLAILNPDSVVLVVGSRAND